MTRDQDGDDVPEWGRGLNEDVIKPLYGLQQRHGLAVAGVLVLRHPNDPTRLMASIILVGPAGDLRKMALKAVERLSANVNTLGVRWSDKQTTIADRGGWKGLPNDPN